MKPKGRPTLEASRMRRLNVTLDEATIEHAKLAGDGNLSRGLRAIVAQHRDKGWPLPLVLFSDANMKKIHRSG